MDKHKLTLPISILLGCIILGGFIYSSQLNKQKSIERQQQIDIQAKENQQQADLQAKDAELRAKIEAEQVRTDKDSADAVFNNNLKCQTLLKDLRQRWNNVVGIYYDEWQNTCIVRYTKDGETKEGAIENMQDTK